MNEDMNNEKTGIQKKIDTNPDYRPGLEGVIATRSSISSVDGLVGKLEYRGHDVKELSEESTFEETVFLLLYNHLPDHREMKQHHTFLSRQKHLPLSVRQAIRQFPVGMHPIVALQSGISLLQGEDFYADEVSSPLHNLRRCISLIAKVPTIVAAFDRHRNGEEPLPPVSKYSLAENFLFMLTGEPPDPEVARIFDKCLILHAEHTMNASTFTGRVIASTQGSLYSAVSGAVGALSGPLHGGANERTLTMLYSVGHPGNVEEFVEERLATGAKISGIGHRVYKVEDPRAYVLQSYLPRLLELKRGEEHKMLYQTALRLEEVLKDKLGKKNLYPNVDFYSGIVYSCLGIPLDLFTTIFAIARAAGWCAHWLEQINHNRLYRPRQEYIGDHNRRYIPIDNR